MKVKIGYNSVISLRGFNGEVLRRRAGEKELNPFSD
jgi:hypothetical protein